MARLAAVLSVCCVVTQQTVTFRLPQWAVPLLWIQSLSQSQSLLSTHTVVPQL